MFLNKNCICLLLLLLASMPLSAQDDLLSLLDSTKDDMKPQPVSATFKGTRIINGHSVETRGKGTLDFLISHRFGKLNGGISQFFGMDNANIRLGLEYGITDRINIGIGRSSYQNIYDGFVKVQALRQTTDNGMPLSVTYFGSTAINSLEWQEPERDNLGSSRFFYTHQLLLARKFSDAFSLQLSPTLVHRNLVETTEDNNQIYALGIGARQKISKRVSVNVEYFYQFNEAGAVDFQNALAIGFDIETGGHVFQLHLTNAQQMIEKGFVAETSGDFFGGELHFGFNISRTFQLH